MNAAACRQLGHLTVEDGSILTCFEHVAEDECALQSLVLRATVEEVEGNIQRTEVGVVAVVDEEAVVFALLHLQTHGHGLQTGHTLGDGLGREHQVEAGGQAVERVLDGGIVDEGQREGVVHVEVAVGDEGGVGTLLHLADVEGLLPVLAAPGNLAGGEHRLGYAIRDKFVVAIVDYHVAVLEEGELLHALLLQREEILLVSPSDGGEYADGGLDDALQGTHLTRFGDTGLEKGQLVVLLHLPDGEGDANLRVVTAGRAHDAPVGAEQLVEPLLDDSLTVAAGDAHHGDVELLAMTLGQLLERLERTRHQQVVGIGPHHGLPMSAGINLRKVGDETLFGKNKIPYTTPIEFGHVLGAIVAACGQRKEERLFRKAQRTAVGKQPMYGGGSVAHPSRTYLFGNLFNSV